ncbi:MAG: NAD(P)-dependent oxidoreductase [Candidatus Nanopelagicales bacterium]
MAEVAVLGMGRMGAAMARKVAAAGHGVRVWNRTAATAEAVAAADPDGRTRAATSAAECVAGADVVLSMLADGEATCAVLLDSAVLDALGERTVVVDLGTSGVAAAARLAQGLGGAGRRYVDAPVSGSVPAVEGGTLLVMASGDEADVDDAREVLGAFARAVLHLGAASTGQVMKLAVNLVVHDLNSALSEGLALAESAGVPMDRAYDVLQQSVVGAPFVQYKRAAFLDDSTPVAMSLDLVAKDLRLILELAASTGVPAGGTQAVLEQVEAAVEAGRGGEDMAALVRFLRVRPGS